MFAALVGGEVCLCIAVELPRYVHVGEEADHLIFSRDVA
jgi:hypothetical protein